MTREEKEKLIWHLKYNQEIGADYTITDEDAVEIIKALEQEPCEDAISRQAVLDLIEHYNSDGLGSMFYGYEEGVKFTNEVNKLSPVKPQEPVLDKVRAEIEEKYGGYDICEWFDDYDYEENDISEYRSVGNVSDILAIIDKHKAEFEPHEGNGKE